MLSKYKTIIVPDVQWLEKDVLKLIKQFKDKGGKIITVGSTKELRDLADIQLPTSILKELDTTEGRKNLVNKISEVTGSKIINIESGSKYIAANIVHKQGTNRYFLHFVNYNEPIKNVKIKVDLKNIASGIKENSLKLFSPDKIDTGLKEVQYENNKLSFTMPELNIYNILELVAE